MKRIILIIVIVLMLMPLSSCSDEFTFRGSRFGDSMQQVKQAEGDDGKADEQGDYKTINYDRQIYNGYTGVLSYYFKDDELKIIIGTYLDITNEDNEHVEDVYSNIKETFLKYGKPTKEEALEYSWYQALWENDKYGIALLVEDGCVIISCSMDTDRVKKYYSSYHFTDLLGESGNLKKYGYIIAPDFYNDPYEISSFIPVPKEGYEYTVRDSISEEELSILKDKPSIQQLISAFGYPSMSHIYRDSVMENGEKKFVKKYYLYYVVDGKNLDVIYDENCNFIRIDYYLGISAIPEANGSINIDKPIGAVRNDITRDELSFINSETTPEELQSILGAPHRECYNSDLFRRTSFEFIRFFMSRHFLYPLKDGGVLDVRYSKGNGVGLDVSTADIYDDNGEITVLVDYELLE